MTLQGKDEGECKFNPTCSCIDGKGTQTIGETHGFLGVQTEDPFHGVGSVLLYQLEKDAEIELLSDPNNGGVVTATLSSFSFTVEVVEVVDFPTEPAFVVSALEGTIEPVVVNGVQWGRTTLSLSGPGPYFGFIDENSGDTILPILLAIDYSGGFPLSMTGQLSGTFDLDGQSAGLNLLLVPPPEPVSVPIIQGWGRASTAFFLVTGAFGVMWWRRRNHRLLAA